MTLFFFFYIFIFIFSTFTELVEIGCKLKFFISNLLFFVLINAANHHVFLCPSSRWTSRTTPCQSTSEPVAEVFGQFSRQTWTGLRDATQSTRERRRRRVANNVIHATPRLCLPKLSSAVQRLQITLTQIESTACDARSALFLKKKIIFFVISKNPIEFLNFQKNLFQQFVKEILENAQKLDWRNFWNGQLTELDCWATIFMPSGISSLIFAFSLICSLKFIANVSLFTWEWLSHRNIKENHPERHKISFRRNLVNKWFQGS